MKTTKPSPVKTDVEQAKLELATAAKDATSAISSAALDATKLIAANAAEALKVSLVKTGDDHDFLLTFSAEVKTKLDIINENVKELKEGTANRIALLEKDKLNTTNSYSFIYKKEVDSILEEHEKAIDSLREITTRMTSYGVAALFAVTIAEFLISHFWK